MPLRQQAAQRLRQRSDQCDGKIAAQSGDLAFECGRVDPGRGPETEGGARLEDLLRDYLPILIFLGLATALLDGLKAAACVWIARALAPGNHWAETLAPAAAIAIFWVHVFPTSLHGRAPRRR